MTTVIIRNEAQSDGAILGAAMGMMPAVRGTVKIGKTIKPITIHRARRTPRFTREGGKACPVRNLKISDGKGLSACFLNFMVGFLMKSAEFLTG